jgi:uncharacterized protein
MYTEPLYQAVSTVLTRAGSEMSAAEAHGLLCGALCIDAHCPDELWMQEVLDGDPGDNLLAEESRRVLRQLRRYTQDQLNTTQFLFTPLLPGDAQSLHQRALALQHWCEGFLLGSSVSGLNLQRLTAYGREFIEDLTQLANLDEQFDEDDSDENAYMELVEYLRVGTMTLYEERTLDTVQKAPARLQ